MYRHSDLLGDGVQNRTGQASSFFFFFFTLIIYTLMLESRSFVLFCVCVSVCVLVLAVS